MDKKSKKTKKEELPKDSLPEGLHKKVYLNEMEN